MATFVPASSSTNKETSQSEYGPTKKTPVCNPPIGSCPVSLSPSRPRKRVKWPQCFSTPRSEPSQQISPHVEGEKREGRGCRHGPTGTYGSTREEAEDMCWFTPGGEQWVILHCYKGDLDVDLGWMSTKVLRTFCGYVGIGIQGRGD